MGCSIISPVGKKAARLREKRAEARPAESARPSRRGLQLVICLPLILVIAGIYQQTLHHDFIDFDDNGCIFDNKHVQGDYAGATAMAFRVPWVGN